MPKGKKKGNKGHGHVWQKDDEQNECDDCGTLVDTWCLHCEACSHCDELGNGYPCKKAEMEQWLQEVEVYTPGGGRDVVGAAAGLAG